MTRDEILSSYTYGADTGLFCAKTNRPHRKAGEACGVVNADGYLILRVGTKGIAAHRAAWIVTHGVAPSGEIDHINGVKLDNRMANLRDVSPSVNAQNKRKARSDNKCGLLGVSVHKGGFRAVIHVLGRQKYLGQFSTPDLAHAAYLVAKRELHEGCTL